MYNICCLEFQEMREVQTYNTPGRITRLSLTTTTSIFMTQTAYKIHNWSFFKSFNYSLGIGLSENKPWGKNWSAAFIRECNHGKLVRMKRRMTQRRSESQMKMAWVPAGAKCNWFLIVKASFQEALLSYCVAGCSIWKAEVTHELLFPIVQRVSP